jgi:hypothetical protein
MAYDGWAAILCVLAIGCAGEDASAVDGAGGEDGAVEAASTGGSGTGGRDAGGAGRSAAAGGAVGTGGQPASGGSTGTGGSSTKDGGSGGKTGSGGGRVDSSYDGPIGTPGVWTDVTPAGVDLSSLGACGNYGTESVQADVARPGDLYTLFMCQGLWKSTDTGQTWTGPINTGSNGSTAGDCAGAVKMVQNNAATPPTLFLSCIRGNGIGFWRSTNGGVDWTRYQVAPAAARQEFYPPAIDPYDPNHLLIAGHGFDMLAQSFDGGQTWSAVTQDAGMAHAGTIGINFIDTGDATTTKNTWLWMASDAAIGVGTWRTSDGGVTWTKVESSVHPGGVSDIYQPDAGGVVYMPGAYSTFGHGVFRSTDYGVTWAHVGQTEEERTIFGTSKNVYAMFGAAVGPGGKVAPNLEVTPQPGTGTWTTPATPPEMIQGPGQAAVVGSVIVVAGYNAGLWRYVEP